MLLWTPKATCTASSLMALWLMCAWWPAMAPSWVHTGADVPTVQGASCALVGCPTKRRARRQGPSLAPLFPTCRVVLAAASRFFRALFTGHWQQAAQPGGGPAPVVLSGLDGDSLRLLLHAIYSRRLPLTAEGAEEEAALLLGAANYLEVRGGSCALSCFCAARSLPYSSHPCCCHTRVSCIPACINSAPALTRRGAPAAPPPPPGAARQGGCLRVPAVQADAADRGQHPGARGGQRLPGAAGRCGEEWAGAERAAEAEAVARAQTVAGFFSDDRCLVMWQEGQATVDFAMPALQHGRSAGATPSLG